MYSMCRVFAVCKQHVGSAERSESIAIASEIDEDYGDSAFNYRSPKKARELNALSL